MLFNSFHFLVFYVVVLVAYFAAPHRWRWLLLLVASYYFYMCWRPAYALLLAGLTGAGYAAALGIERGATPRARRAWFAAGLLLCAGLLVFFKYLDFVLVSLRYGLGAIDVHWNAPLLHLIIPVGISFHTFQSIAYLADVHRGAIRPERHLGIYALFIVFFPQLLAGPIERSGHMLPQFHAEHVPTYGRIASGARWALWGLFKKMAIADLLAPFVSQVYDRPQGASGAVLLLATFFFAIQIYCDFSGYSDIAVGVARIMGYELMVNFRQPYFSRTLSEFWSRWHVSLSTWFRDYVYIPLGGNRVPAWRWAVNILIVFVVSGLWHGAGILFLLWGLVHGLYLLAERWTQPARQALARVLLVPAAARAILGMLTVFVLVLVAWVLFRAKSVDDAAYVLRHLFDLRRGVAVQSLFGYGLPRFEFVLAFAAIAILAAVEAALLRFRPRIIAEAWRRRPVRWACYAACAYGIVFFGVFNRVEFIYFQF